jgi:hypothetical protein
MDRQLARGAAVWAAIAVTCAGAAAAQAQAPEERDVRRPDGTVVRPIAPTEPAARPHIDPGSPARLEQESARKAREEENAQRIEAQRKARVEQLERTQRERDAAADSPVKRQ